jgi:hypothetical protein
MFTAHDSGWGTPGQLVGGTAGVQVADDLDWLLLNRENQKSVGHSGPKPKVKSPTPCKNQRRKDGPPRPSAK